MAARVAASARAAPHACLAAALATFTGALHGGVGAEAARLLTVTMESGHPERALAQAVAGGHGTPGFGHLIYRDHDPRAETLLGMMRPLPRYARVLDAVDALTRVVRARVERPANIDLALAALAVGADMSAGSGTVLFAIARTAGWIAHIADEYAQQPLRLRPQARYTGDPTRTI
jgi:citrate synthase